MVLRPPPRGRRRAFTETSDQKFKTPQQQQQKQQQNTLCESRTYIASAFDYIYLFFILGK